MSYLSQFISGVKPPKVINNYWSGLGASATKTTFDSIPYNDGKKYTPSLTATVLTTLLSITGSGGVDVLYFKENSAGIKTIRIKVTLDGNVIFDQTSPSVTYNSAIGAEGLVVLGRTGFAWDGAYKKAYITGGQPIIFNSSLLVEVESSTTDAFTDFYCDYWTN